MGTGQLDIVAECVAFAAGNGVANIAVSNGSDIEIDLK
jgi:hypothetical protein